MKKYLISNGKIVFLLVAMLASVACTKSSPGGGGGDEPKPQKTRVQLLASKKWNVGSADITLASNGTKEHVTGYTDYSDLSDVTFSAGQAGGLGTFSASSGKITGTWSLESPNGGLLTLQYSGESSLRVYAIVSIDDKNLALQTSATSSSPEKYVDNSGAEVECSKVVLNMSH